MEEFPVKFWIRNKKRLEIEEKKTEIILGTKNPSENILLLQHFKSINKVYDGRFGQYKYNHNVPNKLLEVEIGNTLLPELNEVNLCFLIFEYAASQTIVWEPE